MFPGLPSPSIEPLFTVAQDGANVSRVNFVTHAGTHIDAPRHAFTGAQTVDEIPLERLSGEALIADLTARPDPALITLADLQAWAGSLRPGDIFVVVTGAYRAYGTPGYHAAAPALDPLAAKWLTVAGIAAYATDATTIETPTAIFNPVHQVLLAAGIPIIENLANLDQLVAPRVRFICLPLKLRGADGAPCRVIAEI
jgi:kynurenine formamidase